MHAAFQKRTQNDISFFLGLALAGTVTAGLCAVLIGGLHRQIQSRYSAYLGRHIASSITVYNIEHMDDPILSLEGREEVYALLVEKGELDLSEKDFLEGVSNVELISKGQNIVMARYVEPAEQTVSILPGTRG